MLYNVSQSILDFPHEGISRKILTGQIKKKISKDTLLYAVYTDHSLLLR
jgi:hypothetical protein